jgi:alginate O-acetyltransferase complex protein AlgJ
MKITTKIYQLLLTVLFVALILFSFLNDIFLFYKAPESSETEKRKLSSKPVFDVSYLDPFPQQYESYFNDHFPFRGELGFCNTLICFFLFNQSPLPNEVELGKHGWLFYDQKESVVYEGKFTLADWQVSNLVDELHQRALMYKKRGIKFYIAFPPMKPEVYPELLPVTFKRASDGTVTDKIVKAIKADSLLQYIDLKESLLKSKSQGRLYALTDNHWNWAGAFYGYTEIIDRIRKDFPQIKAVTVSDVTFQMKKRPSGNLAVMIGLSKFISENEFVPHINNLKSRQLEIAHEKPDWASAINNYELVKCTGDSTLPVAVIICDSFTDVMMPYLDESFDTTTYIFDGWRYTRNQQIIDAVNPDIVLLIIFEPHISHVIGV